VIEATDRRIAVADVVESVSASSSGVLLLATRNAEGDAGEAPRAILRQDDRSVEAECLRFEHPLPPRDGESEHERSLLMVCIPEKRHSLGRGDSLLLSSPDLEVELDFAAARRLRNDLKTFAREQLASLGACERAAVLRFLARALALQPHRGAIQVAETLSGLREALRERLPRYVHLADRPRGMSIDSILAIDDTSFYMSGWLRDEEAEITRFDALSPEGDRAELLGHLYRFPRKDVTDYFSGGVQSRRDPNEKAGFVCFFELASPSFLSTGWVLELENADGAALETSGPPVIRDPAAVRTRILTEPARDRFPDDRLMEAHVMPAMLRIAKQIESTIRIESVTAFGDPPREPLVSIVVPLYKRIDLIEQQLAEFARDPELSQVDLIYVLDSPEQKDELIDLASRLFPIYLVPLRVAVLQRNVGFANANNAGVSIARAPLLLLMNSDVLPDRPGWLSTMASFYEQKPEIGALAPKLLYEDGSIQHAGMHFHQPMGSTLWQDAHYFRGLHRDFPDANVTRRVPLVSGACLMVAHELYDRLGGLQARYVQGDYEDADLCMRLNDLGLENWYLPEAELFHLEALSYGPDLRLPANRYNAWLHTHLWRSRIQSLVHGDGSSPAEGNGRVPT
jgi:O-antigen biosynthesis protein